MESTAVGALLGITFLIIVGFVYFLPTIIANNRRPPNFYSIVLLNVLLGWTIVGWLVAFKRANADK